MTEQEQDIDPYRVTVTTNDVIKSNMYKMTGTYKGSNIQPDMNIKNKLMVDKRKALIRILKDKRPE